MEPWSALVAMLAAVVLLAAGLFGLRRASRRRAPGDPLGAFLRHFEERGVPPELAHAAYEELRGWLGGAPGTHSVEPDDELGHVYGVAPDERREAVELVARACGRALPEKTPLPGELATVDDLVVCVARLPAADARPDAAPAAERKAR